MSASQLDRLVKMVNQIALNMSANGTDKVVADQVAQHLEKFWSPPMKKRIIQLPSDANVQLSAVACLAIHKLAEIQKRKSP